VYIDPLGRKSLLLALWQKGFMRALALPPEWGQGKILGRDILICLPDLKLGGGHILKKTPFLLWLAKLVALQAV
jgi:hypothetical protein